VLSVAISTTMESTSIVVPIPSFVLRILTIPNVVLDVVLVRDGGTKGSTIKSKKAWA
jgi:hypothetical protein